MKIQPLVFDTYMAMIQNSVGSKMWRNNYALVDGVKTDVTNNGEVSCAYYLSTILASFRLIKAHHTMIDSTLKDMENSGWVEVAEPEPGDVLLWGPKSSPDKDGVNHQHLGFYIGEGKAVTHNYVRAKPNASKIDIVDMYYRDHPDGKRPLLKIYRGKHLLIS